MPADFSELLDSVNNKVLAAIDADEAGDPSRALQLMEQASLALAVIPDGTIEDSAVSWDREAIDRALNALRRRINRSTGVITQTVRFERG